MRILFVGQEPETVDFSDRALPPGFNAEKIHAGIAVALRQGCGRAQRAKAANTRATDAQIASFCNCIGSKVAATTTYKQMGASNLEDYIK